MCIYITLLQTCNLSNIYLHLGKTSLSYAVQWGQVDVVHILLEHGANVNAKNNDGELKYYKTII